MVKKLTDDEIREVRSRLILLSVSHGITESDVTTTNEGARAIKQLLHDRDEARAKAVGLQARLEGYMEGAEIGRAMAVGDRNPDGNDFAAFGRCPSCGESVREVL